MRGKKYRLISEHLDTNGDGTGTINAVGDYSSAVEEFYIAPGAGEAFEIARLIVSIGDTAGMQAEEYGNLGAALTNGIEVQERNGAGIITNFTNSEPIKDNAHWGAYCFDVDLKTWGAGNELLLARWTFEKSGAPLRLVGNAGEYFAVRLNDNFTGLISHHFIIQGVSTTILE